MVNTPVAINPPNSILLPGAVIFPLRGRPGKPRKTSPPIKLKVSPLFTCNPTSLATDKLIIGWGLSLNVKPIGISIVNNGG